MGKAIIIKDISFANVSIGKVHAQGAKPLVALGIIGPAEVNGSTNAAVYTTTYMPINTTERGVAWSVVSGGLYASIDSSTGVLSINEGVSEESIVIRATSVENPSITVDKTITVTYLGEVTGYITNGLVAHWDGIDKNNNNDSWKWGDLVGGNVGSAIKASIFNHGGDYALFANGNYLDLQTYIPVTETNYTIEVCYEKSASPTKEVLLISGKSATDAYAVFATWGTNGDYIITGRNENETKCWVNSGVYPQTASVVNQLKCVINGQSAMESTDTNYYTGPADKQRIGAGQTKTPYAFTGKIYSIRIYNRSLSHAEILNNQSYDKIRFGL